METLIRKYFKSKTSLCVLFFDFLAIIASWCGAVFVANNFVAADVHALPVVLSVQLTTYRVFTVYRSIWRFSSLTAVIKIVKAILLADLVLASLFFFFPSYFSAPASALILYPLLLAACWSFGRLVVREHYERCERANPVVSNHVLLIGAGKTAELFLRDLKRTRQNDYLPVAILDDDESLHKRDIHDVKVVGPISIIKEVCEKYTIDMVIIAMSSVGGKAIRRIVDMAEDTGLPVKMLPSLSEIASGKVAITALREVSLEDLLGREPVKLDAELLRQEITGKVVLVTGGGGSIGAELCRQIALLQPEKLIIVDHAEYNLYRIEHELVDLVSLGIYLVDITDEVAIEQVFLQHKPHLVYHAAAYKHVPMLEPQIRQAMKNNFYGTKLMAELSAKYRVEKFVMISTDKAVNPTNVMGATKRASEIFCQNFNLRVQTKFVTVRFGNVLGSNGSVVPLFKEQLAAGGPLTVTHPDITRYFMTIPEACQLVLQAGAHGKGGEIFVLDMGEPVKICHLAEQLIRLSGKKPYEDIDIVFTGLRPGEKLYEELFHPQEKLEPTSLNKVFRSHSRGIDWDQLQRVIAHLQQYLQQNAEDRLLNILNTLVPEYQAKVLLSKEPALSMSKVLSA